MKNDIFRRVEEKYFLIKEQAYNLFKEINTYIEKDEYYKSNILNIYFDNNNDEILIRSGDKPIYEDKIRLRSYSTPALEDDVFLEIKSKYNGVTGKRRIRMKLSDFYNYINNNEIKNTQIMNEIDYLFKYYDLKPSYFVGYDRLSYKGKDNEGLRITLDSNLRSRTNNLNLEQGDYGELFFNDDRLIMEIKTLDSMPLWLTSTLSKLKIYPISFSKVGEIYKKEMVKC